MLSQIAKVLILGSAVTVLAACAGSKVNHGVATSSSASGDGNVLQNQSGEKLSFVSINDEPLGNISSVSTQNDSIYVQLKNPLTGRKALVRVDVDPSTGKFKTINATSVPYMCYDAAKPPCAGANVPAQYPNAGAATVNCDSPIFFRGALTGSVNDVRAPNSTTCS